MSKPTIIVTGASRGIGLAVTRFLLQKFNANVVALSRSHTKELLELSGPSLLFIPCDVTDEAALTGAIALALKTYSHIDGLVLNAATLDPVSRIGSDTPVDAWKTHFDVNFFSLITAVKAALPALRDSKLGGRVIFVSSGAAEKGYPGWGPYSAGKAAMNSLNRTLAEEEPSLTCVALRPGIVDTSMQTSIRAIGANPMGEAMHQKFVQLHNEGKLLKPEDPGHVIAALAVQAPKEFSGQFVSWDSVECKPFRRE